ncbi:MAG: OB-fold nucleic acid binding domain-containing protein [Candidatus Diapherotrites archaeon]
MRATAIRIPLKELNNAEFVKVEEQYVPSYVLTESGLKISRVSIFGVVVRRYENERFMSVKIDDFTGTIDVMAFEGDPNYNLLKDLEEGDSIKVIGRIKQGNNGLFIAAEGVRKLSFYEEMLKRLEIASIYKEYLRADTKLESLKKTKEKQILKDGTVIADSQKETVTKRKKPMLADFISADELDIDEKVI